MLTSFLGVWLVFAALPLAISHLALGAWVRRWSLGRAGQVSGAVCVVIPARNEAANIEVAVRAALAADGVTRLVVVDDGSEDGTLALAARASDGDPRFFGVAAPARPAGWAGKSWAITHGVAGDEPWILFLDADVRVAADAVGRACGEADARNLDLLSAFGRWETPTAGTAWLVPAFGWVVRSWVRPELVERGEVPFANGQFILVRREIYARSGGHGADRGAVLDDVALARAVQRTQGKVGVRFAPTLFTVRPYGSAAAAVRGWRKNLAVGAGGRLPATLGALLLFVVGPGPLFVAGLSLWMGEGWLVLGSIAAVALQVSLRARLDGYDGRPATWAWSHPAGLLVVALTLLAAAFGPAPVWKGRAFPEGKAR